MSAPKILLAYLSPDSILPLTSIVATIAGAAMLFTRGSIRFLVGCFRAVLRRPRRLAGTRAPHFKSRHTMLAEEPRD